MTGYICVFVTTLVAGLNVSMFVATVFGSQSIEQQRNQTTLTRFSPEVLLYGRYLSDRASSPTNNFFLVFPYKEG